MSRMLKAHLDRLLADAESPGEWSRRRKIIRRAHERNRKGGSTTPDGYPRGGGGRGSTPGSTTEAAVLAREKRPEPDPIDALYRAAVRELRTIADASGRLDGKLADLERVMAERVDAASWCEWHLAANHRVAAEHSTTLGGRLVERVELCTDCRTYGFNHEAEAPEYDQAGQLRRRRKGRTDAEERMERV